jgi:hypothetical protein
MPTFPPSTRRHQRLLRPGRHNIHRARNVLAKVPAGMQAEIKDAYWKLFGTQDLKTKPGPGSSSWSVIGSSRWRTATRRPTRRR